MASEYRPQTGTDGRTADDDPRDPIQLYNRVIGPAIPDKFLERFNPGLGNHKRREYYQNVEAFFHGTYADAAFSEPIQDLAVIETKRSLGVEGVTWEDDNGKVQTEPGWNQLTDEEQAEKLSRRAYVEERGEQLWDQFSPAYKDALIRERTSYDGRFIPPHYRMIMMRTEASKSIDARVLDNVFGRVSRQEHVTDTQDFIGGEA